jgi:hypothetical protein
MECLTRYEPNTSSTSTTMSFRSRSFAMKQPQYSPSRATLVAALTAAFASPAAWAVDSGSTGADGAFSPTVSQEVPLPESGVLNYTTINIPAGVKITFKRNTANTPVYVLASGDATIAGTIDISGRPGADVGTSGDGSLGDDGIPGNGGPGGYGGGRGGREDGQQRAAIIRGGAGLGPGGGPGGVEGGVTCSSDGYYPYIGVGGAYAADTYKTNAWACGSGTRIHSNKYGSELLQPIIGGSGGGGGRGGTNYTGSGGGGGGGAILIASSGTLTITGSINASGGKSGAVTGEGGGGRGAGGSGGAIRLVATKIAGTGTLFAYGGCDYAYNSGNCDPNGGPGYQGSPGRIRLEPETMSFTGASSPAYVRGSVAPIFIANAPSLRITSVAGQAVPPNPTGIADVTLPAGTEGGPIQVVFNTTNIPVGEEVELKIVPAYGAPVVAISGAVSGSSASGTAQATVTLPAGPSTLQATTTYTVVVASLQSEELREKLSRLAQNEQVEKIEVTVALQGSAMAKLITASGKTYDMPYADLSAIGFRG